MLINSSPWVFLGLFLGTLALFWYLCKRKSASLRRQFEVEAREERLKAKEEHSHLELAYKDREAELERAIMSRRHELDTRERELAHLEERTQKDRASFLQKEKEMEAREAELEAAAHEAEKGRRFYKLKLYHISQMDAEEARQEILRNAERECQDEIQQQRRRLLGRSDTELMEESRRVLLASMQRITSQSMNDATATVVALPSEEMKGRIIGREGRNIRTFEHSTGTTLMIDEAPDSVLVSSFDPVRREVARLALESLVRDGRIHPSNIEAAVSQAEEDMSASIIEQGESAVRELRLSQVDPEVIVVLGKLHYRLSNNQNTLAHSVEVANLCSLIASEIGLDPDLAKRAGLLHDIGKALSEEYEGSHAIAGSNFVKQYGEDARVVNAVAAHHQEVEAESTYAGLVMVADSLSAVRPGARTASIDGFIHRVRSIEEIALEHPGVVEAYAIQAGREVRVIVEPNKIDDDAARTVARNIRTRIENELSYPGSIEITVIREQRFQETAV
ncbi:MAG: ribonuclease Y [Coraliomargaritaceae bacterium]